MTTKRLEGIVRDATSGAGVGSVTVTIKKTSDGSTVTSTTTDNASDVGYYSRLHDVVGYPGPVLENYTSGATTKNRDGRVHGQLGGLVWADDANDVFAANGIGVVPGVGGDLAVTADGVSGLQVAVAAGMALLKDGLPYVLETGVNATIAANASGNPRIDRVVLRETREGQTDQGKIAIVVITGTPAGSPVAPALVQTAATWDTSLSQVLVGNGVANIAADKTTDERYSTALGQAYAWAYKLTTTGDLPYVDASGKSARLAVGTSSQFLKGGTVPAYGSIAAGDLPTAIDAAKIGDGSVSTAEFQFLNTVTSNVQTQLDGKQPLDADLTTIAGLVATTDNMIQGVASTWASRTPAQVRTALGLVVGTNVQAWDADLDAFALKTAPAGAVVGTTDVQTLTQKTLTSPVVTTPTGIVKGDVGLGNVDNTSDATKNAAAVTLTNKTLTSPAINTPTITGGSWTGGTDLAVADGGTAASTAAAARTNLGLVIGTDAVLVASPTFTGRVTAPLLTSSGSAPTAAIGAAAGAGATLDSIVGNDTFCRVTLTTAGSPASGTLFTINWNATRPGTNYGVWISPANSPARTGGITANMGSSSPTTTQCPVAISTALSTATQYIFNVLTID